MTPEELRDRTARFAVKAVRVARQLYRDALARGAAIQLCKAASSMAANYRATCLSRSRAEFVAKLGIVVEEADEAVYWLELVDRAHGVHERELLDEARQLARIFTAARHTAQRRQRRPRSQEFGGPGRRQDAGDDTEQWPDEK